MARGAQASVEAAGPLCGMSASIVAITTAIHKPSARVSFDLPDPLSFQVRSHVIVARRSSTHTRQGKRQGQAADQPDPPSWNAMRAPTRDRPQMYDLPLLTDDEWCAISQMIPRNRAGPPPRFDREIVSALAYAAAARRSVES